MAVKIKIRRDIINNWESENPILSSGEFGLEKDTRKLKIGDGSTAWNDLDYIVTDIPEGTYAELDGDGHISTSVIPSDGVTPEEHGSEKHTEDYAILDGDGYIAVANIPPSIKETKVVNNITARDNIDSAYLYDGLRVYVIDASDDPEVESGGAEYIYDDGSWIRIDTVGELSLGWEDIENKPTEFNPSSHTHAGGDITSAVSNATTAANLTRSIEAGTGLSGGGELTEDRTLNVDFGSSAGTACEGNDSRLAPDRTRKITTSDDFPAEGDDGDVWYQF